MKKMFMWQWLDKKMTCASYWILVPQSLDAGSHIILINGIIIIHLSECIELNFDWADDWIIINTRNFLLFFLMYGEWKQVQMENGENYLYKLS